MEKKEAECSLSVQRRVRVHGDGKCDIRTSLDTKIDYSQSVPWDYMVTTKTAIHIAKNVVFYERTKHIEVDCHIVRKKLEEKIIVAKHVSS